MGQKPVLSLWLILFCLYLFFNAASARATISVLNYWRMGENDPGAVAGGTATVAVDSAGNKNLIYGNGAAVYSASVASSALSHVDSTLSVCLTNSAFASNSIVTAVVNNFGIEAWVNPEEVTNGQIIAYDGNTATSGWGILVSGSTYSAIYGGKTIFGTDTAVPGVWAHVALVRNNGTATLYVNGVAAGTSAATPAIPVGNFALGAPPSAPTSQFYTGLIDEVRVFTFTAGAFSTNDLLLNQPPFFSPSTTTVVEGPVGGYDAVNLSVASSGAAWQAVTTNSWLHPVNTNGTGNSQIGFTFDGNSGATRTGTLTIGGTPVTVTQAGVNYSAAGMMAVIPYPEVTLPEGLAVDGAGNVYIFDGSTDAILKWNKASQALTTLFTTNNLTAALAVDSSGNVYFGQYAGVGSEASVLKWNANNQTITTLIPAGTTYQPGSLTVDAMDNVYFDDGANGVVREWNAASQTVSTLITGLGGTVNPEVDFLGNIYFVGFVENGEEIGEWNVTNQQVTILLPPGYDGAGQEDAATSLAVTPAGNLYIGDSSVGRVWEWNATNQMVTTADSADSPFAIGVDNAGDLYFNNVVFGFPQYSAIEEVPRAFLVDAPRVETGLAGSDSLPPVVPTTASLTGVYAPTSNEPWLVITGVTNGVVSYSFTANNGATNRTASISLLGQQISVTQSGTFTLGLTNLLVGPGSGANSITLASLSPTASWTATTTNTWLQFSSASGQGSTNLIVNLGANTGSTRTGTITVAGETITITQAGANYIPAGVTTLVSTELLYYTAGAAVDGAGNVYISDETYDVYVWDAGNQSLNTLFYFGGLAEPAGLALDSAKNLYIACSAYNSIQERNATNGALTTVVSGLNDPTGVALDSSNNIYIADNYNNAIEEWNVTSQSLVTLVNSGLSHPYGVGVDIVGNVYFSDEQNSELKKWNVANHGTSILSSGLASPRGVAVDGGANVYFADAGNYAVKEWNAASQTVSTLVSSGLAGPSGIAVDGAGNIYIGDHYNAICALRELSHAFVSGPVSEPASGGNDSLPPVVPATVNLTGVFYPSSDQSWLTITGVTNDIVSYSFADYTGASNRVAHITLLGQQISVTQMGLFTLGTSNLLEAPGTGTDSVALAAPGVTDTWTASANAAWLHLINANGIGSTNVGFTLDANAGPTREATLTIAGIAVTITQAGSTYVAAGMTNLISSGLSSPTGVAIDGAGNVYFSDSGNAEIKEWNPTNSTVTVLISNVNDPTGLAMDSTGNLYFDDPVDSIVGEWNASSQTVTNLINSGLDFPEGVAVDGADNLYIGDAGGNDIQEWNASSQSLIPLVSSGLNFPSGVAVDVADNVYIADTTNNAVEEWNASSQTLVPLVESGLILPRSVAVDGSGNVYIGDTGHGVIDKWQAGSQTLAGLVSGLNNPLGVAVDAADNLYIADTGNNVIRELPHAFVDDTTRFEPNTAGTDSLPPVVPATANLAGVFYPTSDQPWLNITGVTNGVVSYAFSSATNSTSRTAHITLLSQQISVTQYGRFVLGTTNLVIGPSSGTNSVLLAAPQPAETWSGSANASWLHLIGTNGIGSTNAGFTFDSNTGSTRIGTLTLAGTTVTFTQAGSNYLAAGTITLAIVPYIMGIAVDSADNVYLSDTNDSLIKKWNSASQTVSTLISSGLNTPCDVAIDGAGNLYIANSGDNAIDKWNTTNQTLTPVISSGLGYPEGVAVDNLGNIYIADTGNDTVEEWNITNQVLTTLASGLYSPGGVAVDVAGNVYINNTFKDMVKEWNPISQTLTTLVGTGLHHPQEVALDGGGNVYLANIGSVVIKEWNVTSQTLTNLSSGLLDPAGVALDGADNIYIADSGNSALKELPCAFIGSVAPVESGGAGNDSLPPVVPANVNLTGIFAPASDQSWLTITGVTNGVVNYAFTINTTGSSRVAHITVLGVSVTVTQQAVVVGTPPKLTGVTILGNGISGTREIQFTFTNNPNASFTVLASTNLTLPLNDWLVIGTATNIGGDVFEFATPENTNGSQMFYQVRSP